MNKELFKLIKEQMEENGFPEGSYDDNQLIDRLIGPRIIGPTSKVDSILDAAKARQKALEEDDNII